MIAAILAIVMLLQWVLFAWTVRSGADERRRMLHAIVTNSPGEYVAVERAAAAKPKQAKKRDDSVPAFPIGL